MGYSMGMKCRGNLIACCIVLLAGCCATHGRVVQPGLMDGWYRVASVIDGDTIVIDNIGRVRFSDRDAPELDEPGGREARERLIVAIGDKPVYVRWKRRKRDGMPVRGYYGRLLARIYAHEEAALRIHETKNVAPN